MSDRILDALTVVGPPLLGLAAWLWRVHLRQVRSEWQVKMMWISFCKEKGLDVTNGQGTNIT